MSSKVRNCNKELFGLMFIIIIIIVLCFNKVEAATNSSTSITPSDVGQRIHCYVTNWLPDNVYPLKLHIWSSEDDLGYQYLNPNQSFYWTFKINIGASTSFRGEFWWAEKDASFVTYDGHVNEYCHKTAVCVWMVQPDGFYITMRRDPRDDDLKWLNGWRTPAATGDRTDLI
ncbi:OLC1v1025911C1 [Oldenlandia corymbosa var. corymbosa]|uniref:S-protein homolog n=1 Tax=Oldenlandia corymbosa var. corymbosa TaxID=529605 RepID=A0AAV1C8N5_OLDCO|nr:OLC1v1025911C1 [Oldenlandia corymbosa var. corymbosa]